MPDIRVPRRLPSLTALRAFEAVGRLGTLRAAGNELGVSYTVVSRHLRQLQDDLQVTLTLQEGRRLVLTDAGQTYHREIAEAFGRLTRATASLRENHLARLNIWCVPGLLSLRLLPRLPELTERQRNCAISIQPTLAFPDLIAGEADAAIVYAPAPPRSRLFKSEELARPRGFPVASPAYLARNKHLTSLNDLLGCELLHEESMQQWNEWLSEAGVVHGPVLHGQRLWHAHLALEAARLGQGIALANEFLVEDELRSGSLVEVLQSQVQLGSYWLITLETRWQEPSLAELREWLREILRLPGNVQKMQHFGKES